MKNYVDVKGKNAVVTGASSGLGKQFALCLAEQGANVAIVARRLDRLEEVKKEIEALGVQCVAVQCDVTVSQQIVAAVETIEKAFGRIDILINNAGRGSATLVVDTTDEEWEQMMATNVNGVFFFAREVGKVMLKHHYGKIVNIGSFHCQVTMNNAPRSAYSTTKGAVYMMTKALANEWAKSGITVNTLGPGFFASEMTEQRGNDPHDAYAKMVRDMCPMGRYGQGGELNGAMLYFASDASSYCTGQLLIVDGGWTTC